MSLHQILIAAGHRKRNEGRCQGVAKDRLLNPKGSENKLYIPCPCHQVVLRQYPFQTKQIRRLTTTNIGTTHWCQAMGCCFPCIPNIGVISKSEVFGPTTLNQPDEARRLLMSECSLMRQLRNLKVKLTSEWKPRLAIWAGWIIVMLSCEVRNASKRVVILVCG